jgi:hypothetical protein
VSIFIQSYDKCNLHVSTLYTFVLYIYCGIEGLGLIENFSFGLSWDNVLFKGGEVDECGKKQNDAKC